MNITVILVLDEEDLVTDDIIESINRFPSANPCLYQEIKCKEILFRLFLLHIAGKGEIGIKFQGNSLTFDSQPKIEMEGKCFVAISHLNDEHSYSHKSYFTGVNFNGIPVTNVPFLSTDFTEWKVINSNPLTALCSIPGEGYETIIDYFNSFNCDQLFKIFGNLFEEN